MSSSAPVTTWYLEQTAPEDLRPAAAPAAPGVRVERAEVPSGELGRFLYAAVGGDVSWIDRLPWTVEQWQAHLERPGSELWVAYERGTPAGYIELDAQSTADGRHGPDSPTGADGPGGRDGVTAAAAAVEIAYFGLLPAFRGRGIGGHLLSYGTARAWDLAGRWAGRPETRRVWVHTCSLDGPYALGNYQRRGFRVTHTTVSH
jgi:ribosomal protein S18 acetylase RimI-like enzyme